MPILSVAIDSRRAKTGAAVAKTALNQVSNSARKADRSVRNLSRSTKTLGTSLAGLFGAFSAAILIRKAVTTVSDFELAIVTLGKVAGETGDRLLALEVTARQLGVTTKFTAIEAADGLLFLARAGFTAEESIEAIGGTLNLAQAGMLDLGEAADLASNVLRQFSLSTSDTNRVVDDLINVSNRSNTSVRQLGQALKFVGPIAAAAGQSLEETVSQIGVLGDAGIQASIAGTNLRGVMLALASPTVEASKAFKSLGLDLEAMQREGLSTTDILQELAQAGLDVGRASDIFGRRNASAALIIGQSAERVRELTQAQLDNAGAAEEQARAMDDTLAGSLKSLGASFDELLLTLGDSGISGAFRKFIDLITDGLRFIVGIRDEFRTTSKEAAVAAAAIKLVGVVLVAIVALKAALVIGGIAVAMNTLANASARAALNASPLITIFAVLATVAASIKIGEFLGEEFKIAAEFSIRFGLFWNKLVEDLKLVWNGGILIMQIGWQKFNNVIADVFLGTIKTMAGAYNGFIKGFPNAAAALGLTAIGPQISMAADKIAAGNAKVLEKLKARLQVLAKVSQDTIDGFTLRAGKALREIDTKFGIKSRIGDSLIDSLLGDLQETLNGIGSLNSVLNLTSVVTLDVNTLLGDNIDKIAGMTKGQEEFNTAIKRSIADQRSLDSAISSITSSLTSGIFDAISGAKDLRSILSDTARQISEQITKQLLARAISGALTSLVAPGPNAGQPSLATRSSNLGFSNFSANGNAFSRGNVTPFAHGGVVNSPTTFGMSGGRTGLMGEAGPEAILPLSRKGGKLGVTLNDGGGGGTTIIQNFNITTPNADSFRRSRTQILSDARASLGSV